MANVTRTPHGRGKASTILLVDDAPAVLIMYGTFLRDAGFEVVTAESAKIALASLTILRPALIVVDYMMPDMNGHQLLARIREQPELRRTPVLFLTSAGDDREVIDRALALGASAYLEKPAPEGLFLELVRSLLD